MNRCIQLAKNGLGTTYPNPLVGSVIVNNNIIIGEGWHYKAGTPHAEVIAIENVRDTTQLEEATMYVSLEPCSHFGKTPPCADLIIERGIKNVVIGSTDPNPKVSGKGIAKLMKAGCHVTIGVLEKECDELNKRFFTFQNKKRPYVFLKWAETADGFIAPEKRNKKAPVWITSEISRQFVHKMRSEEQAILVGTNTVLEDNPSLTTREWSGESPIRLIIDKGLKIPEDATVFSKEVKTIIITEQQKLDTEHLLYRTVFFKENLPKQICDIAFKENIQSIIIEGGAKTLTSFIEAEVWDEAYVFTGTSIFNKGVLAPTLSSTLQEKILFKQDTLTIYKK